MTKLQRKEKKIKKFAEYLDEHGIEYKSFNQGWHLKLLGKFHYWPDSERFATLDGGFSKGKENFFNYIAENYSMEEAK
jgi:hypothetical protein